MQATRYLRKYPSIALLALWVLIMGSACTTTHPPGHEAARAGDEIVAAGRYFHTGTKVVLWMDPGGYDGYRVERRFAPFNDSGWAVSQQANPDLRSPNRYSLRRNNLSAEEIEAVRGGGWELSLLQRVVDQFVIHYDASGTSRQCFRTLHDERGLSVHFLLDLDGTIYQTLDLKERAWHATTSNDRSIGIEIANIGAYPPDNAQILGRWYNTDASGDTHITLPPGLGDGGIRTPGFVGRPARPEPVSGSINGVDLVQFDFTPEQYQSLIQLTAALCAIFPLINCDYPRDIDGELIPHKLADDELARYQGLIGHYHIQRNKVDPGPAFDWQRLVAGARQLLNH